MGGPRGWAGGARTARLSQPPSRLRSIPARWHHLTSCAMLRASSHHSSWGQGTAWAIRGAFGGRHTVGLAPPRCLPVNTAMRRPCGVLWQVPAQRPAAVATFRLFGVGWGEARGPSAGGRDSLHSIEWRPGRDTGKGAARSQIRGRVCVRACVCFSLPL